MIYFWFFIYLIITVALVFGFYYEMKKTLREHKEEMSILTKKRSLLDRNHEISKKVHAYSDRVAKELDFEKISRVIYFYDTFGPYDRRYDVGYENIEKFFETGDMSYLEDKN